MATCIINRAEKKSPRFGNMEPAYKRYGMATKARAKEKYPNSSLEKYTTMTKMSDPIST
jgi:hypothetical protein